MHRRHRSIPVGWSVVSLLRLQQGENKQLLVRYISGSSELVGFVVGESRQLLVRYISGSSELLGFAAGGEQTVTS